MAWLTTILGTLKIAMELWQTHADPRNKKAAMEAYLSKKVIQDWQEAKLLIIAMDSFWEFAITKMGLKTTKDKGVLIHHFKRYKAAKKRFFL